MGIFKKPVEKTTTAKSKEKHVHVKVVNTEFNNHLKELVELKEQEKLIKSKVESLEGIVKEKGKDWFLTLYGDKGVNPNTFILESEDEVDTKNPKKELIGAQVMVLPMDKYLKIDEERANEIKEMFGRDVDDDKGNVTRECDYVQEKIEYKFNNELLEKHFSKIEKALEGIKGIPQEDKDNLITATASYSIKPGTIDLFKKIVDETHFLNNIHGVKNDVSLGTKLKVLLNNFQPIFSLKSYMIRK